MSRVFVCGVGAVSPAGWTVAALRDALARNEPLPTRCLDRPRLENHPSSIIHHPPPALPPSYQVRLVPPPNERPAFLSHPRLRRASPLTQFAAAAALEAGVRVPSKAKRGLIVCLQSGPVQYVSRFMEEILKDPAIASPLVFPETVFAAPASHIAAVFGDDCVSYTLLGDPASYLQGVALATQWLETHCLDACLVVGAEEINWIHAEAMWHFQREAVASAGAGAICLTHDPALSIGIELQAITDPHLYSTSCNVLEAARRMRAQLHPEPGGLGSAQPASSHTNAAAIRSIGPSAIPVPSPANSALLCDGVGGTLRYGAAERAAWSDWTGPRVSPKRILGEGLMAAAAWQCVAACDGLANGRFASAIISLVGCDQQAIGARFVRTAGLQDYGPRDH